MGKNSYEKAKDILKNKTGRIGLMALRTLVMINIGCDERTITSYLNSFDMENLPAGHPKTIQQWALLGDPTLKIGGY